jgi:hypothetical protein
LTVIIGGSVRITVQVNELNDGKVSPDQLIYYLVESEILKNTQ